MASKSAHIASLGLAFCLSLSAQAEDNKQADPTGQASMIVSEEIIVVAPKALAEDAPHLAIQQGIADPQDLILQNLAERLNSADKVASRGQLDI